MGVLGQIFRQLMGSKLHNGLILIGLMAALTSVYIIAQFVIFELSHGQEAAEPDRVYRMETAFTNPGQNWQFTAATGGPAKSALESEFGEIEHIVRFQYSASQIRVGSVRLDQPVTIASAEFFDVFGFEIISGDARTPLKNLAAVALSETTAKQFFGDTNPIGKVLTIGGEDHNVSAVFRDLPDGHIAAHEIVIPVNELASAQSLSRWGWMNYYTFFRLRPDADISTIEGRLVAFIDRELDAQLPDRAEGLAPSDIFKARFVSMPDIHLFGARAGATLPPGNIAWIWSLIGIAGLILGVAAINFTTLAGAQLLRRQREMGLRKMHGATSRRLLLGLGLETTVLAVLAAIGANLVAVDAIPFLELQLGRQLALPGQNWVLISAILMSGLFAGLIGALFPALSMVRGRPVLALTSTAGVSGQKRNATREVLVGLQFTVVIALSVATLVVSAQTKFAEGFNAGSAKEDRLVLRGLYDPGIYSRRQILKERIASIPGVEKAALSYAVPGDGAGYTDSILLPGATDADAIPFQVHHIDEDFLPVMSAKMAAGRMFQENMESDFLHRDGGNMRDAGNVIINKSALSTFGFEDPESALGDQFRLRGRNVDGVFYANLTIVGVVEDIHYRPIYQSPIPAIFVIDQPNLGVLTAKLSPAGAANVIPRMEEIFREMAPDARFTYQMLEDSWNASYASERSTSVLIQTFAYIITIIACLGLFGISSYGMARSKREIAIRKVFGAGALNLVLHFLRQYSRPVLLANLFAWPIAFIALQNWLAGFAFRIDLDVEYFLIAGVASVAIATVTVLGHIVHFAGQHPIHVLRYE